VAVEGGPAAAGDACQQATANGPQPQTPAADSTGLVLGVLIGIAAAAVGLYFAATLFPAHPKTLARDSVLVGFVGAALLVEEIARGVMVQFPRIVAIAIVVGPPVAVLVASGQTVQLILAAVAGVAGTTQLFANTESPVGRTIKLLSIDPNRPLGKYGPIVLGLAMLLLGVFLQLRSIHYSPG
jgi:uncharacterized membrane protein YeaQ/YmgE (transglycosylase-associated protein family)